MPTYSITPSAHPVRCLPQCPSPSHPNPLPTSLSTTPCLFPRVRSLSCSVILTDIFTHFSPFPFIPFHYFLYSPNEWDHIMFVLLRLTYFPQHNALQFHPCRSKWWVFVVSNGWGIFHCIHKPQLLYPSSFDGPRGSFHSLAIVDIAAMNIGVQVSQRFIASVSLG